ncbi:type VI secretion system baseplate subunit TssF [Candidatus Methylospira mobilis]|nr:type VI secretion system baseplate subunit TssF [Candidatus Methylospira mobilis]
MNSDDKLYRTFIEELHALKEFRLTYALDHPASDLDLDDPAVKRIIEVLAFFGARTETATLRYNAANRLRLYQQFFPYLLSPLPAMAIVQAKPTGRLTEVLEFPQDTEFALQPEKGGLAFFRSMRQLRVLPFGIEAVKLEMLPAAGCRLLLMFQADYPLNEHPGRLSLYINYLNDFVSSLKVFHYLKRTLRNTRVQFGGYDPECAGMECHSDFDASGDGIETDEWRHPLEVERDYFHFPQQALYLHLELPPAPRNWKKFTVALECSELWPRKYQPNKDLFQLFTVPLSNSRRGFSEPVLCDGTQERYSIRHPHPESGFKLQKVLGVYEITEKGMLPLRPGLLAGGNGSYEIEQDTMQADGGSLFRLLPHFPEAFEQPRTLAVEALWLQPWFDRQSKNSYTLKTLHRQTVGVKWELTDNAETHVENQQINSSTGFLHLLTLMHKTCLSGQDVRDLLQAMGSVSSGRFRGVLENLNGVRLEEMALGREQHYMTKQTYYLKFKTEMDDSLELTETFAEHLNRMLDLWIPDAVVDVLIEKADEPSEFLES